MAAEMDPPMQPPRGPEVNNKARKAPKSPNLGPVVVLLLTSGTSGRLGGRILLSSHAAYVRRTPGIQDCQGAGPPICRHLGPRPDRPNHLEATVGDEHSDDRASFESQDYALPDGHARLKVEGALHV